MVVKTTVVVSFLLLAAVIHVNFDTHGKVFTLEDQINREVIKMYDNHCVKNMPMDSKVLTCKDILSYIMKHDITP